jgi:hypothetical protein
MKRLLLFVLVLSFIVAQAQSQTSSQKRPKFSPHSKRAGSAKPPARAFEPYFWLEEMEGDSSLKDERLRNSLPPSRKAGRGMKNLPPHILAERRWLLQSEAENAGLEPNDFAR